MKKIEIFDPAMCCPTGLCGTNINPELMRIAVVIESLKTVNDFLQKHGADALPITLVDGEIAVSQTYPTTKQMSEWTGVNLDFMPVK